MLSFTIYPIFYRMEPKYFKFTFYGILFVPLFITNLSCELIVLNACSIYLNLVLISLKLLDSNVPPYSSSFVQTSSFLPCINKHNVISRQHASKIIILNLSCQLIYILNLHELQRALALMVVPNMLIVVLGFVIFERKAGHQSAKVKVRLIKYLNSTTILRFVNKKTSLVLTIGILCHHKFDT
jgi:hypothetical protein